MSAALEWLNALSPERAREEFLRCCGARRWAELMVAARPFANAEALFSAAEAHWSAMKNPDWREAFEHHPRIGAKALRDRWASGEQKGVQGASEATLQALEKGNRDYESRFGHVFLVCATGKSADEMLALLVTRMKNDPQSELRIAAGEQAKITRIRLEKLLKEARS